MDRRELLGVLGATAAGLAAVGGSQARADHEDDRFGRLIPFHERMD